MLTTTYNRTYASRIRERDLLSRNVEISGQWLVVGLALNLKFVVETHIMCSGSDDAAIEE